MNQLGLKWILATTIAVAGSVNSGCMSGASASDGSAPDLGMPTVDMVGPAGPDFGCYPSPTTHLQIINACTGAQSLDKSPALPLLNKDGTLPSLP